jgi:hypothetical protein
LPIYYAPIFMIRGDISREVSNDPTFFIERENQSTPSPLRTGENKGKVKLPRLNTDLSPSPLRHQEMGASSIEEGPVKGKSTLRKVRPYLRERTKQGQGTSI